MAEKPKFKEHRELIAGIITLGAAVILLIVTALCMSKCSGDSQSDNHSALSSLPSIQTAPTRPPLAVNPYGPGDFAYDNGYLTCISGESVLGIDVSSHQGAIRWGEVAESGVGFAMVRIGYRGWGNGELYSDEYMEDNLQGAENAGLKTGAYFFSQAISVEEAVAEAQFVLDALDGRELSMPIAFDWEYVNESARTAHVDIETVNACAVAFCETIREAGYAPMVYFNLDISNRLLDLQLIQEQGYPFWLAMYSSMTYPYEIKMWQYTEAGQVPGIDKEVDLNLYFPD